MFKRHKIYLSSNATHAHAFHRQQTSQQYKLGWVATEITKNVASQVMAMQRSHIDSARNLVLPSCPSMGQPREEDPVKLV